MTSEADEPEGMPTERVDVAATAPLVLVVEDDPDAARVAQGMLNLLGYRSRVAHDAHDALHQLSRERPALLLLDVNLPSMDGVAFLTVARQLPGVAAVPVVAASAVYASDGPVARRLAAEGVRSFLEKPFSTSGLRTAIERALASRLREGRTSEQGSGFVLPGRRDLPPTYAIDRVSLEGIPAVRLPGEDPAAWTPPHADAPAEAQPAMAPPPPPPPPRPSPEPPARPATAERPAAPPPPAAPEPPPARGPRRPGPDATADGLRRGERSVVREVQARARTTEGTSFDLDVEAASRTSARLRVPDPLRRGDELRLEVHFRAPVNDAMTDLSVRMLVRVDRCEPSAAGAWVAEASVLGAGPDGAFAKLVEQLRT